jgi:hypothetical protein
VIGQTVSHDRVVESKGVVYKAEDTNLGRTVALYFPDAHLLDSESHKSCFLGEA